MIEKNMKIFQWTVFFTPLVLGVDMSSLLYSYGFHIKNPWLYLNKRVLSLVLFLVFFCLILFSPVSLELSLGEGFGFVFQQLCFIR